MITNCFKSHSFMHVVTRNCALCLHTQRIAGWHWTSILFLHKKDAGSVMLVIFGKHFFSSTTQCRCEKNILVTEIESPVYRDKRSHLIVLLKSLFMPCQMVHFLSSSNSFLKLFFFIHRKEMNQMLQSNF